MTNDENMVLAMAERDRLVSMLEIEDPDVRVEGQGVNLVTGESDVSYTRASEDNETTYWVTVQALDKEK
jgi:hypothetical protein